MASGSNLHWVDYVVIVGYFALVIAVGIISSMKVFISFMTTMIIATVINFFILVMQLLHNNNPHLSHIRAKEILLLDTS